MTSAAVRVPQKGIDLGSQSRQVRLDHTPHDAVVDPRVGVHKDVAEGNDPAVVRDLPDNARVQFGEAVLRLADDLELAFDRGSKHRVLV